MLHVYVMVGILELPLPGEILVEKYELLRVIGKGGMGVVFEARHRALHSRVAVKVLKPELAADAECVARFEREARAAARLTGVNIARAYDVGLTQGGLPFIVLEFLVGRDLLAELAARRSLGVAEAVDIILQACTAMSEAHALGIVHRDLKPANLFLCGTTRRTLKVLDFGISKVLAPEGPSIATTTQGALGTPHYMSPEQVVNSRQVDARADIWAVGVILYRLLTARFPFDADTPMALALAIGVMPPRSFEDCPHIPPPLADAVMKALAKNVSARWQNIEDFARAIEPFGSGAHAFAPASIAHPHVPALPAPHVANVANVVHEGTDCTIDAAPASPAAPAPNGTPPSQGTQGAWTNVDFTAPRPRRRGRWAILAVALTAAAVGALGVTVTHFKLRGTTPAASIAGPSTPLVDSVPPAISAAPTADAAAPAPPTTTTTSAHPSATVTGRRIVPPVSPHVPPPLPPKPSSTTDPLHL